MGNQLTTKPPTTKPQTTGPVTTEQDLIMNMLTTEQDQWTLRELETFFLAAWWPHKGAGGYIYIYIYIIRLFARVLLT